MKKSFRDSSEAADSTLREALGFSRSLIAPYRKLLFGIAVVLLVETASSLSLPLLGGKMTEALLGDADGAMYALGALIASVLLVQMGSRIIGRLGMARIGDEMLLDLRRRTFEHLQRLPITHHDRSRRGDQLSLLTTDAQSLSGFLSGALPGLLPTLLTLGGALAMLAWLRPGLALIIALAVPAGVIALKFWMRAIRQRARAWFDAQSETVDIAEQSIEMLPLIKAEAREARQERIYLASARRALDKARAMRRVTAPLQPLTQLMALGGIVALLLLAAGPGSAQAAEPGELVTLLLYGVLIARPLSTLADLHGRWNGARGALARILETLHLPPENGQAGTRPPKKLRHDIIFQDLSFGYEPGQPVLENFRLEIKAGERIAITGPNGCGKSTLIWLLLRFYRPWQGSILLDGTPLEAFSLPALRRSIALVPQRVWLFQGSIADNIRLGRPNAADHEVRRAAHLAGASEFIERLHGGYSSQLGPRGANISGGQQQRLALARALIRPTPILVLDEATSMFDDLGEQQLMERIKPAIENRTVILVTHRPRLLELADRRIHMTAPNA
ncbi:MAG: ABC transporter ATP-binding protein [Wenzhouxiangellaceae bacterium]|nr:ABC transporter ATP-binding protein [Wenzhouxiangellaceae bacterium]